MTVNVRRGSFFLMILSYGLLHFNPYVLALPAVFTEAKNLGGLGGLTKDAGTAAHGLSPEEIAALPKLEYRTHLANYDPRLEAERTQFTDAKNNLEVHQERTYKLALDSHARAQQIPVEVAQKEIDAAIGKVDLVGTRGEEARRMIKSSLIEKAAKEDQQVKEAYNELTHARAKYTDAKLKLEVAAKTLQNAKDDPSTTIMTKELRTLDDEEYVIEASKSSPFVHRLLVSWLRSKDEATKAIHAGYRQLVGLSEESEASIEASIAKKVAIFKQYGQQAGLPIDDATARTLAERQFITEFSDKNKWNAKEVQGVITSVNTAEKIENFLKHTAVLFADRHWAKLGKLPLEGKRYKGWTPFTPFDKFAAMMRKGQSKIKNFFRRFVNWVLRRKQQPDNRLVKVG